MARKELPAEGDPPSRAAELKKELMKLVAAISDDEKDDSALDAIDKAKEALLALRDLKSSKTTPLRLDDVVSLSCPDELRCPLSKQLMRDPVVVSTGQTYDRAFIQKWLKSGQRVCPKTQQVLSHTLLTPNCLIKEMIHQWCRIRGIMFPDQGSINGDDSIILRSDREHFSSLIDKIQSNSIADQKSAAKELRLLTKKMPAFRALFGEFPNSIPKLIKPIANTSNRSLTDLDLEEDLITTLLNVSIHDSNKKVVAETPMVLPVLIEALRRGKMETRSNAAATLFTLSALDPNKALIGQSGALPPLITLLDESDSHPSSLKDAASAIFNLCILHENKTRAVHAGAVKALFGKIKNNIHLDEVLSILAVLSTHQRAIEEMGEVDAVHHLLRVMRESTCARNKENCVAILFAVCVNDRGKLREVREEDRAFGTLSKLAREGTSRARRKASGILERVNRGVSVTHTA